MQDDYLMQVEKKMRKFLQSCLISENTTQGYIDKKYTKFEKKSGVRVYDEGNYNNLFQDHPSFPLGDKKYGSRIKIELFDLL